LKDVKFDSELLTIAYEPVWAIGTGLVPSSEQIAENHSFIRSLLETKYPDTFVKILYGGSLNAKNADEILAVNNVNGGLIGGASLDSNSFLAIYISAQKLA
jgi:triosephosphate isomerase